MRTLIEELKDLVEEWNGDTHENWVGDSTLDGRDCASMLEEVIRCYDNED